MALCDIPFRMKGADSIKKGPGAPFVSNYEF